MVLILGAVTGGVVAWFWSFSRSRAATASTVADLRATIGAHEGTITELRNQVAERNTELVQLRGDLDAVRARRRTMKTYTVRVDIAVTDSEQQVSEVKVVQVVYTCDTLTEAQAFAEELVSRLGEPEVVDGRVPVGDGDPQENSCVSGDAGLSVTLYAAHSLVPQSRT